MKIAYFTAGDWGAGHFMRGLAVLRGLSRAGFQGTYRMFGPKLPFPAADRPDYEVVPFNKSELQDRDLARESELARALRRFDPDLVLVDLFWAPVLHILPTLRGEAWLLLRDCPPVWLVGPERARFDAAQYARIIAFEPIPHNGITHRIEPIVVCNPDERRSRQELCARFGVPEGRRIVVVTHAGLRGEIDTLLARASGLEGHRLVFDLFDAGAPVPAAEWLPAADAIVCGAGFNAYWQARWLGYEARATFVPFERRLNNEHQRLVKHDAYRMRENGADQLARWIVTLSSFLPSGQNAPPKP